MSEEVGEIVLLGVDPGFSATGYACARKNKSKTAVFDYGYLKLSSTDDIPTRTEQFYNFFHEKIKTHGVTHIALETPFLGKNPQSFLKLGYLRGVLNLLSKQYNLKLFELSPRQVKQAVTGFGGASKEQVAQMIGRLFPQLGETAKTYRNDVTDALAICICGIWMG